MRKEELKSYVDQLFEDFVRQRIDALLLTHVDAIDSSDKQFDIEADVATDLTIDNLDDTVDFIAFESEDETTQETVKTLLYEEVYYDLLQNHGKKIELLKAAIDLEDEIDLTEETVAQVFYYLLINDYEASVEQIRLLFRELDL